ncbi:TSUP family transporter [Undibacterium sp. Ji50W]|uniref:TSUP family transporter n=1 Tax=Undibacterium sp. Ji50W TaxID=3413041 RepID=UPI003BF36911
MAGLGIGMVAALLGVAGGELLIPTIVLLYGVDIKGLDIKLAGSLSLAVSFPTMIVGFARYSNSNAFSILRKESSLFRWMVAGSILGAGIGGLLLGIVPSHLLISVLGGILLISAIKTFKHSH